MISSEVETGSCEETHKKSPALIGSEPGFGVRP
jgi:hypothetical protein